MDTHDLAVLTQRSVHLGAQRLHLKCSFVQWTPNSSEVVADIFKELESGESFAHAEATFDEAATNGDDDACGPGGLRVAGGPEVLQDPLYICQYMLKHKNGRRMVRK